MGRLGFLTSLNRDAFFDQFDRIVAGDWEVEERLMVAGTVTEGEASGRSFHGLNDIVLSRRSPGRPVYVELAVDGERVALYRCDGMIVATPHRQHGLLAQRGRSHPRPGRAPPRCDARLRPTSPSGAPSCSSPSSDRDP